MMLAQHIKRIALIALSMALVGVGVGWWYTAHVPVGPELGRGQETVVTLSIEGLYSRKNVEIVEGQSLLSVLQALNTVDPSLQLKVKEYPGLGTLVTSMVGKTNGSGSLYWQYRVRGVMPMVGAGDYHLRGGEVVEWFFAASQQ